MILQYLLIVLNLILNIHSALTSLVRFFNLNSVNEHAVNSTWNYCLINNIIKINKLKHLSLIPFICHTCLIRVQYIAWNQYNLDKHVGLCLFLLLEFTSSSAFSEQSILMTITNSEKSLCTWKHNPRGC